MKTRVFMTLMLVAVLVTLCSCAQIQKAIGATGERNNHADNDPEKAEFSTSAIASTIADETASEIVSSANPTEEETASETADHADPTESEQEQNDAALTQKQANSIAMLNYLAMISQEIESAKDTHNSRLILEDVYSSLLNNTNPDKLDEKSQFHLTNLLDIIEDYRVIAIKRERLQLLYDQEMDDYTWTDGANVTISIGYKDYCEPLVLKYIVKYTENWWILPDTVEFIMQ